jgi:hypothetical protein
VLARRDLRIWYGRSAVPAVAVQKLHALAKRTFAPLGAVRGIKSPTACHTVNRIASCGAPSVGVLSADTGRRSTSVITATGNKHIVGTCFSVEFFSSPEFGFCNCSVDDKPAG